MKYKIFFIFLILICTGACNDAGEFQSQVAGILTEEAPSVTAPPTFFTQVYYTKYIDAAGIAIVAGDEVDDSYLIEAREAVLIMTSKYPELRETVQMERGFYMILLPYDHASKLKVPELENVVPYISGSCRTYTLRDPTRVVGYCFAHLRGDPRPDNLRTFVHEFAHAIDQHMRVLDPRFQEKVERALEEAKGQGLPVNVDGNYWGEYWATSVVLFFYDIRKYRQFETHEAYAEQYPLTAELLEFWFPKASLLRRPPPNHPADINGDGKISDADVQRIENKYRQTCEGCPEDLNEDGIVNWDDKKIWLLMIRQFWTL